MEYNQRNFNIKTIKPILSKSLRKQDSRTEASVSDRAGHFREAEYMCLNSSCKKRAALMQQMFYVLNSLTTSTQVWLNAVC